jgi:hypothetical protein
VAGTRLLITITGCESDLRFGTTETPACGSERTLPSPTPQPEGEFDSQPYPDKPGSLTGKSSAEYVTVFERALVMNARIEGTRILYNLDFSTTDTTSSRRGRGFVVRFRVSYTYGGQVKDPTPITEVGDAEYRANYIVSDRIVMRVTSDTDDRPNPIEDGEVMQCSD